jgi:O-antigen ligase
MTTRGNIQKTVSDTTSAAAYGLIFIAPVILFFARHSPTAVITLAASFMVISLYFSDQWGRFVARLKGWVMSGWFMCLVLFCIYACLSTIWSLAGVKALVTVAPTLSAGLTCVVLVAAFYEIDDPYFQVKFIGAILICALLIILESKGLLSFGLSANRKITDSNRASVLIALCIPMLLGLLRKRGWTSLISGVVLVIACTGVMMSQSESSKLAIFIALLVYISTALFGRWAWNFLISVIILAFIFNPLVYASARDLLPQFIFERTSFQTVEIRTFIWTSYAKLVSVHPILGFGAESSSQAQFLSETLQRMNIEKKFLQNVHPHSIPLQIWFELGLVGCVLVVGIAVAAFKNTTTLAVSKLPEIGAFIAVVTSISFVSHGAWQPWWPCVVALGAVALSCNQRASLRV